MMNSCGQEYKITMNGHLCLGDEKILRLKQLPSLGIGLITEVHTHSTCHAVPCIRCKTDYDWLNTRSSGEMSA